MKKPKKPKMTKGRLAALLKVSRSTLWDWQNHGAPLNSPLKTNRQIIALMLWLEANRGYRFPALHPDEKGN